MKPSKKLMRDFAKVVLQQINNGVDAANKELGYTAAGYVYHVYILPRPKNRIMKAVVDAGKVI